MNKFKGSVQKDAAIQYAEHKNSMLDMVNREMQAAAGIFDLIGGRHNLQTMLDNHRNHASFMSIVFQLNNYKLLADTTPWVYRSYHNQGFSYDYFILELNCWIDAIKTYICNSEDICEVYQWMLDSHSQCIEESQIQPEMTIFTEPPDKDQVDFEKALLKGDHREAFRMVEKYISDPADLKVFYTDFIRRSMYRIGMLWETGEVTVAVEHLSSAIITRLLSALYTQIELPEVSKGKILISSATNEYHEIGAWMVANVFELEGWDVLYLGANTPIKDLLNIVLEFQPDIIGLSVTMPYNLEFIQTSISMIKEHHSDIKIFVGGSLAVAFPEILAGMDIDYIANSFDDAVQKANEIWTKAG